MLKIFSYFRIRNFFLILSLLLNTNVYSDNFDLNTYNNHGVVGLINTPTARFYDEGVHGITLYDGTPHQIPMIGLKLHFFIVIFREDLTLDTNIKTIKIKVLTLS